MNQHQQAVIDFLQEENRVLLEQLGGKPRRFTDSQRVRLARKAKLVGRRRLGSCQSAKNASWQGRVNDTADTARHQNSPLTSSMILLD